MAKKNQPKEEDFFDLMSFEDGDYSDDMIANVMDGMLEVSKNQMSIALELTKLIVKDSTAKNMEEHVFSVFKKAVKVAGEAFDLKNLMEQ